MMLLFKDEEEVEKSFLEGLEIMIRLRQATDLWHEHYGHKLLGEKKFWEKKADDYLSDLKKRKKIQ